MGKSSSSASSAPAIPDYTTATKEQARLGTQLNRYDQSTPLGSSTWSNTGDKWTLNQTMTPTAQATFDAGQNYGLDATKKASLLLSGSNLTQIDPSSLPAMPVNAGTTAQQAIMSRLAPQQKQQSDAFEQQMANQGLAPGTVAYDNAKRNLTYGQNDLQTQAALQGINTDMSTRNQSIQNQIALQNQPVQLANALRGGAQTTVPSFNNAGSAQTPDLTGAMQNTYNANMGNYGAQVNQNNNITSGLFGLGGAVAGSLPYKQMFGFS